MKKITTLILTIALCFTLFGCNTFDSLLNTATGIDETAINNVVIRIEANELDAAISLMQTMDEKTLGAGKSKILSAIIKGLNSYLNFGSWVATNHDFVYEKAVQEIKKYQTLVGVLNLNSNESNVGSFISKALQLEKYVKWNSYHRAGGANDIDDIKSTMDQGAVYKSNPSIASKYYQQAYNECVSAYNTFNGQSAYGMQETADFYYQFSVQIKAIISQKGTTGAEDNSYNIASKEFKRILSEYIDAYDEIISICESFPKKLY